jgi:Domain of unknown function (DUF2017)
MIVHRKQGAVEFRFSLLEKMVLERALATVAQNYKINPAELDEHAAAVWYSPAGCRSAGMSAEETSDWLKQLQSLRMGRVAILEECLRQLNEKREQSPIKMEIGREQADSLMTAINDHRLLVAAHHNIGEAEMNMRTLAAISKLPPSQQTALFEIEFLAYLIDELLQLLSEPAGSPD